MRERPTTDPDALIAEIAITEVVPSKVVLNTLGYAPFGIGLAVKAVRAIAKDKSTVAFEARVRDAQTQEILLMLADREAEQIAAVTVRGFTWYSHAHRIIDSWSDQFVQVANRDLVVDEIVKDTKVFTLKPW